MGMNHMKLPHPASTTTMLRKDLQVLLLENPQPTFYNGASYNIRSKHLGTGVYEVWLTLWKPPGQPRIVLRCACGREQDMGTRIKQHELQNLGCDCGKAFALIIRREKCW